MYLDLLPVVENCVQPNIENNSVSASPRSIQTQAHAWNGASPIGHAEGTASSTALNWYVGIF
jgi:hypothetical protein